METAVFRCYGVRVLNAPDELWTSIVASLTNIWRTGDRIANVYLGHAQQSPTLLSLRLQVGADVADNGTTQNPVMAFGSPANSPEVLFDLTTGLQFDETLIDLSLNRIDTIEVRGSVADTVRWLTITQLLVTPNPVGP